MTIPLKKAVYNKPAYLCVKSHIKSPRKPGMKSSITNKDAMLMTLMKIRLGLLNQDLADRFGTSKSTVSRLIKKWRILLANRLSCLVYHPDTETVKKLIPPSFKSIGFGKVEYIPDCTEIFIETPRNPITSHQTWSQYKHHNTYKTLVVILPNGQFNFISKGYGGRASDKYIAQTSGFMDLIRRDTEVLADKGFVGIEEDLALKFSRMVLPPGRRGSSQLSVLQGNKTKKVANKRIYVEQAIRRLKTFRLLKFEVPISIVPALDDFVLIAAAICNIYPHLCKL